MITTLLLLILVEIFAIFVRFDLTVYVVSNRTGTYVDDCAGKSNNWLDQWQSGKLGTASRV